MRAAWLERRRDGPLRAAALLPLSLLSLPYAAGAALHRMVYERGLRRRTRLSCRVVSVGSLLVGGTGKTPLAAWVAAGLRRRGVRAVLASRGAGGRPGGGVRVVSDGRRVHERVETAGDEALLLAAAAPGVPVVVSRDRRRAGRRALAAFDAQVLVLDDGLQHHRLARDLEIVTLDGAFGLGNRRVLPRGPLREPEGALSRADAVVVIDGPLPPRDAARLRRRAPGASPVAARRAVRGLRPLAGGPAARPSELDGAPVGILCGVARPAAVRRTVESLGARVVATRLFGDHHRYRRRDVRDLAAEAPLWLTTEKDAGKVPASWVGRADVRVLELGLEVAEGERFLDWLEERLDLARAATR